MIKYFNDLIQGDDAWHDCRRGLLTASEMKLIVTPGLKSANNEKTRSHVYELAAQRISGYTEPTYVGWDMERGMDEEILARQLYRDTYHPVTEVGFITNDAWGFTLGCSPDGLVGDDGGIEIKSRRQKFQIETIATGEVPSEHLIQIHTCLLVTGRKWWDYVSYSGGLPMATIRVEPEQKYQDAILTAAAMFEVSVAEQIAAFEAGVQRLRTVPTERRVEQEMFI